MKAHIDLLFWNQLHPRLLNLMWEILGNMLYRIMLNAFPGHRHQNIRNYLLNLVVHILSLIGNILYPSSRSRLYCCFFSSVFAPKLKRCDWRMVGLDKAVIGREIMVRIMLCGDIVSFEGWAFSSSKCEVRVFSQPGSICSGSSIKVCWVLRVSHNFISNIR